MYSCLSSVDGPLPLQHWKLLVCYFVVLNPFYYLNHFLVHVKLAFSNLIGRNFTVYNTLFALSTNLEHRQVIHFSKEAQLYEVVRYLSS